MNAQLGAFGKENHTLEGFYTNEELTIPLVTGDPVIAGESYHVYAKWTSTVFFQVDLGDGTETSTGNSTMTTWTIIGTEFADTNLFVHKEALITPPTGKEIEGFYYDSGLTEEIDTRDEVDHSWSNITIYVKYTPEM